MSTQILHIIHEDLTALHRTYFPSIKLTRELGLETASVRDGQPLGSHPWGFRAYLNKFSLEALLGFLRPKAPLMFSKELRFETLILEQLLNIVQKLSSFLVIILLK